MLRLRPIPVVALLCLASCGDLTKVPPPPVRLSALLTRDPAIGGSGTTMSTVPGSVRLVNAVPAGALCTLHLPDLEGTGRRIQETSIYRLLSSREMGKFLAPFLGAVQGLALPSPSKEGETGGFAPRLQAGRLTDALRGEVVICLEDIEFDPAGQPKSARVLAGVTVPGAEHEVEQLIEMVGMLVANDPSMRVEKGSEGTTAFTRLVGRKPVPFVVEMALYEDALLLGVGRDTVTGAITLLSQDGEGALASRPEYHRAMQRCAHEHDALRIYVDVAEVLKQLDPQLPGEARQLLEAIGLDKYRACTSTVRPDGKNLIVTTLLESTNGEDFLSRVLGEHPVDRRFLQWIPAEVEAFSLFAMDGKMILGHLRETLPKQWRSRIEETLTRIRGNGLDLERDIFEVFGPRCALVTVPHGDEGATGLDAIWNHFLGTALVVEVSDTERARKVLEQLPAGDATVSRVEEQIEGTSVIGYEFEAGQLPPGFGLWCANGEEYVVLALSRDSLGKMLQARSEESAERLRDLMRGVPETVTVFSYDRAHRGLGLVVEGLVRSFQEGLRASGSDVELQLPSFRNLVNGLDPSVSYTMADRRGIYFRTRSPTGGVGGTGGLSSLMVLSAVAIPNFTLARVRNNEESAITTLRAIQGAQENFVGNLLRDSDRDGRGEFGFLVELAGENRPGEERPRSRSPLLTVLVRDGESEVYQAHGYYFRVYLPAEDGSPVGGHDGTERIGRIDGDLAESFAVTVAWPVSRGSTGRRAFLMDASGAIYACGDGPYGDEKVPPSDLNCSQEGNLVSEPRGPRDPTRDGFTWLRIRE